MTLVQYRVAIANPIRNTISACHLSHIRNNTLHLIFNLIVTAFFAATLWFSQLSFPAGGIGEVDSVNRGYKLPFSSGLALLRLLQGVTSTLTTALVSQTLGIIEWTHIQTKSGAHLITALSLSPSTALRGLLALALGRGSILSARIWSILRLTLLVVIWLAGVVLFVNTSFSTEYEPDATFRVTAGTANFDGSLVAPTLTSANGSLSYWILSSSSTFLQNQQFSIGIDPINCSQNQENCTSYILPGGIQTMSPNPVGNSSDPITLVHNSPASQIEFQKGMDVQDIFQQNDCIAVGDEQYVVGVQLCLSLSTISNESVIAGIYVCSQGVSNGQCRGSGPRLNVTTTMTVFERMATTTCARDNNSILSVSELGHPSQVVISNTTALISALVWLLNYTAAGLPPESSITFLFWNINPGLSEHDWAVVAYDTLTSMLAFALWFFSANGPGNPQMTTSAPGPDGESAFLPSEFHTTASFSHSLTRFVIDRRMFALYVVFQALPLLFSWMALLWRLLCKLPEVRVSSFPTVDMVLKARLSDMPATNIDRLAKAGDKVLVHELQDVRVFDQIGDCNLPAREQADMPSLRRRLTI